MDKKKPSEKQEPKTETNNEVDELKARLARALADYDNLKKRVDEEKKLYFELASLNLLTKFFPILSNLEKAFEASRDPGVGMVLKQFMDLLAQEGIREIEDNGQFDPNLHEAIAVEEAEVDNQILKLVAKGYQLNGKVIQPAKVVVGRAKENERDEVKDK